MNTEYSTDKAFVTGIYGSGKTHFAEAYATRRGLKYVSFDGLFAYSNKANQSRSILGGLPPSFVMDAIPIDEDSTWNDFIEYESQNEIFIICIYCSSIEEWLGRLRRTRDPGISLYGLRGIGLLIKRLETLIAARNLIEVRDFVDERRGIARHLARGLYLIRNRNRLVSQFDDDEHIRNYRNFYVNNLPILQGFQHVVYRDSATDEYTSIEEMQERMDYKKLVLHHRLENMGEHYDGFYQDIEALQLVGYSESYKTWESIKGLIDWKDKRVIDLGCHHGYFAFKVEDSGGSARGLDRSGTVLETASLINEIRGGKVTFKEWKGGDEIPECDLILCLNVLHHFDNPEKAMAKMNSPAVVFEANVEQRPLIENHFTVVQEAESHRAGRFIVVCEKSI